ncbi:trans-2,3-dihydro-3-hydroxyanthranilate isomerase [Neorhizobium huautlense]|uniref:Trans-2,3-dihydro-3-hydroxyanthranilate isomerase n=1 Tax=Neorhizobium huautlense TaxID=67774 RepID=A0ABT9PP34_9HYPH|nr:PhzF family phenazine biosynthesis protein [Neorhizobium huautlense]MDP9836219.1 trans-2,3-dihydro-3-hydroxyanthranilate isomerase [Neorhizobium huautlense]
MPTVRYVTLDVFTQTRFTGNPLAVILDAQGLSSADMQAIATEFNYSETTFVLPPQDPQNSAQVRIFTPTMEVPFAGHPNVGTAYVLGQQAEIFGRPVGETLRFEEKAGLVEVALKRENGKVTAASIRAPQALSTGSTVDVQSVADCLSLDPENIRTENHQPRYASVGLAFVFAELDGLEALGRAQPDLAAFKTAAKKYPGEGLDFPIFLYVRDPSRPWHIRARMFSPLDNVPEDPATGSASAALAAYLVETSSDLEPDGTTAITIEQGVEMGRRSLIQLEVTKRAGKVSDVLVGGSCAMVMRGELDC